MTELSIICEKINKDCRSIRAALIMIYIELGAFISLAIFVLGVQIGKSLGETGFLIQKFEPLGELEVNCYVDN